MPTQDETKPFQTYEQQLAILKDRGLIVNNDVAGIKILKQINYYRFSAYSLTLRRNDEFYDGVTIENVLELYNFDVSFRDLVSKYSAIVEMSARAYLSYYHARVHGPLGYLNNQYFDDEVRHGAFLKELSGYLRRSTEIFVIHHRENRNGVYPIWVAVEEMTFGMLSMFYKNMISPDRAAIAKEFYNIPRKYVESYLQCSSVARNVAAHGGRFYNRIKMKPAVTLPNTLDDVENDRPFAYIFAIFNLLPTENRTNMVLDIKNLFADHPFAKIKHLGFPENWEELLK